jgi:hypothetical protein
MIADKDVVKKMTVEIQGHSTGFSPSKKNPEEMVPWAAVHGLDTKGRHIRCVVYFNTAKALNSQLAKIAGNQEVTADLRIVAVFEGEFRTDISMVDGEERRSRSLHCKSFDILDGLALENARLRRDAVAAISHAEKLRKNGQLALAYDSVGQFVARFAGVPLDLDEFLAASAADDAEFGATNLEADPEAIAAAHFAREDNRAVEEVDAHDEGIEDSPAESVSDAVEVETALEAEGETQDFAAQDFGAPEADLEFGAPETDEPLREEAAFEMAPAQDDPLEDFAPEEPSAPAVPETVDPAPARFSPGVGGAGTRPASRPFSMPAMPSAAERDAEPEARKPPFAAAPPFASAPPPFAAASPSPFGRR